MSQEPLPGNPPERRRKGCLVCGIVALVTVLPLLVIGGWLAMQGFSWVKRGVASAQFWNELDQYWRPPADSAAPDSFLPQQIASFTRLSLDHPAGVPSLGVTNFAHHAAYRSRDFTLDAYVFTVGESDQTAWSSQIVGSLTNRPAAGRGRYYSKRVTIGQMSAFSSGPPDERCIWWRHNDRVFLVHGRGKDDVEPFLKFWLDAINGQQPPKSVP